jgi:phosphoribosylformylglycinamidine cyclo-ligase
VIYAPALLELAAKVPVHAFAHVTGGGIPGNLVRVLPDRCDALVHRGRWDEPPIFGEIQRAGGVADLEMEHVFNLGLGMVAVVAPDGAEAAIDTARAAGHDAWDVGEVVDGHGRVTVDRD